MKAAMVLVMGSGILGALHVGCVAPVLWAGSYCVLAGVALLAVGYAVELMDRE